MTLPAVTAYNNVINARYIWSAPNEPWNQSLTSQPQQISKQRVVMCLFAYHHFPSCSHEPLVATELCEAARQTEGGSEPCEAPEEDYPSYDMVGLCPECRGPLQQTGAHTADPGEDADDEAEGETESDVDSYYEASVMATLGGRNPSTEGPDVEEPEEESEAGSGSRSESGSDEDERDHDPARSMSFVDTASSHAPGQVPDMRTGLNGQSHNQTEAAIQAALASTSSSVERAELLQALQETGLHGSSAEEERLLQQAMQLSMQDYETRSEQDWQQDVDEALRRSRAEWEGSGKGVYEDEKEAMAKAMYESVFSAASDRRKRRGE